jgi:hemerythrin-like domain-containing protein
MNSIDIMVEEHVYIKRMLAIVRRTCNRLLNGEPIVYEDFYKMIDFIRNYADRHHHGKEEAILFTKMMEQLGATAEKLVRYGMLVEHDLGRLFIQDLEQALDRLKAGDDEAKLDIIANAVSYTNLLNRHIDKEDQVVYKFAQRNFDENTLRQIDEESQQYEQEKTKQGIQDKYLRLLEELETRFNPY